MKKMLTHAMLAAGRGTRMFGANGGNKALVSLAGGNLIDYVLGEIEVLEPCNTVVLVPEGDVSIANRVMTLTASETTFIESPSDGTGPGVRRLLAATSSRQYIALTTCDLCAPAGTIAAFVRMALLELPKDEPGCVIAVSPTDEDDPVPIFVHIIDDVVVDYGKKAQPSELAFAGARVMNAAFARLLLESELSHSTDTEMMTAVVRQHPGVLRAHVVDGLFDVDNPEALQRAEVLTRAGRVG